MRAKLKEEADAKKLAEERRKEALEEKRRLKEQAARAKAAEKIKNIAKTVTVTAAPAKDIRFKPRRLKGPPPKGQCMEWMTTGACSKSSGKWGTEDCGAIHLPKYRGCLMECAE